MDKQALLYCALFIAGDPVKTCDLLKALDVSSDEFAEILDSLSKSLAQHSPLMVSRHGDLIALQTRPEFSEFGRSFARERNKKHKLSKEAMETLAIIAYRQPITKKEIEKIRSCDCEKTISSLLSWRLISTIGRTDEAGNPMLYKTTDTFLHHFGLRSISELPKISRSSDMSELECIHMKAQ